VILIPFFSSAKRSETHTDSTDVDRLITNFSDPIK